MEKNLKFYKTLAVPVLLYDAENWTLTNTQIERIEVTEVIKTISRLYIKEPET